MEPTNLRADGVTSRDDKQPKKPFPTYHVCDPLWPDEWTEVPSVNAWDAVYRFLRVKKYDPATFGAARVFLVRHCASADASEIRVSVPLRFEAQCRGANSGWSTMRPRHTTERLDEIAKMQGWEPVAGEWR